MAGIVLLQGCATSQNRDPLESFNRKMFRFNEVLDDAVLKPVATGYDFVVPQPIQTGIDNFSNNIKDVWSVVNLVLQGRPVMALETMLRVSLNTTLGMAGFVDVASSMQLDRPNEDLGQTLAVWGAPSGAYLMLPLFGPSTVRDASVLPVDMQFSVSNLFDDPRDVNAARVLNVVNKRSLALNATSLLGDVALDKYAFVRDAYLQRRQNLIYNGEPPEEAEPDYDSEEPQQGAPFSPQSELIWPEAAPTAVLWERALPLPEQLDGQLQVSHPWLAHLTSWSGTPVSDLTRSGPSPEELAGLREEGEPR